MSKPLTNYFLALAMGWLSVAAVGWKYVSAVGELPPAGSGLSSVNASLQSPSPPVPSVVPGTGLRGLGDALPPSPSPSSGLEHIGRNIPPPPPLRAGSGVALVVENIPMPSPPARSGPGLRLIARQIPPSPDGPRLPDLDWSKGKAVVLLVGTYLADADQRSLAAEVEQVQRELATRLVGGSVLVADRQGVWTWAEWVAKPAAERQFFSTDGAGFSPAFKAVSADLVAVGRKRADAKTESLVVWHSSVAPEEAGAGVKVPAVLLWSGKPFTEQRDNKVLPKVFAAVDPCGPDASTLASAVKNRLD